MEEKSDFFFVFFNFFFNFLALCVGPGAFLGLERGDKAHSLPLLPHCFIFELEWRGKELLVLAWCWCWSKVGAKLESLKRICESLEETTKGSILQIIGDSSK
jgi:hypothetical protein